MAKLPEGRSALTDEQMIGLTHRLVDTCIDCKGKIEELEAERDAACAEVAVLREALEFYADRDYSGYGVILSDYGLSIIVGEIIKDGGDKARAAIANTTALKKGE